MAQSSSHILPGRGFRRFSDAEDGARLAFKPERRRRHAALPEAASDFSSMINCARRQIVVEEAESAKYLFKVTTGTLKAAKLLADGRRQITRFVFPGEFFGFTNNDHYLHTVEAIEDVTVIRYLRGPLELLTRSDPQTRCCLCSALAEALSAADEHLLLLGRKTAIERLATFLLSIADRSSDANRCEPTEIVLRMNRNDIADYLGLSVEFVSRTFTRLCRRKIISLPTSERVVLLRPDTLRYVSGCHH